MQVLQETFVQARYENSDEFQEVKSVRDSLVTFLNRPESLSAISVANTPGTSSAEIQATFLDHARSLGFRSEAKGLFADYATSGLRPDYNDDATTYTENLNSIETTCSALVKNLEAM